MSVDCDSDRRTAPWMIPPIADATHITAMTAPVQPTRQGAGSDQQRRGPDLVRGVTGALVGRGICGRRTARDTATNEHLVNPEGGRDIMITPE